MNIQRLIEDPLLLAGLDDPAQPKSPKLLQELAEQDFHGFVDGGRDVRDLIDLALSKRHHSNPGTSIRYSRGHSFPVT